MVLGGLRSAPRRSEGMEEFANILQRDYGLKPQGKAAPMTAARGLPAAAAAAGGSGENGRAGSARNGDGPDGLLFSNARPPARGSNSDHLGAAKAAAAAAGYDDVFGGPPSTKYSSSSRLRLAAASGNADDSVLRVPSRTQSARARSSNSPAFHRPLYDDEEVVAGVGVPGARTSPAAFDDVFRGGAGAGAGPSSSSPVDELLGGIGIAAGRGGSGGGGGGGGFFGGGASLHAPEPARANNRNAGSQSSQHADNVHPFEVGDGAGHVDPIVFLWQQQSGRTASDAEQTSLERAGSPDRDGSHGFGTPQLATRSARSLREQRRQSMGSASQPISREGSGNFPAPFSSGHQSAFLDTEKRQPAFEPGWVTIDDVTLKTAPSSQPPPARRAPRPGRMRFAHLNGYPGNVRIPESMDQNSGPSSMGSSSSSPSGPAVASDVMAAAAARGVEGLEEFVSGVLHKSGFNTFPEGESETGQIAAGAPTEMRDAMERAEVKIRLAKEAREKGREEKQREAMIARAKGREKEEREAKEERERERLRIEQLKEREREREKDRAAERAAVEMAAAEARERAATEAREKAEKAAVEKATAEARERAVGRAAADRAAAAAAEKAAAERAAAERAAAEKAAAEARERMERERAKDQQRMGDDFHKLFSTRANSDTQHRPANQDHSSSQRPSQAFVNEQQRRASSSTAGVSKGPSTTNTADDWTSLFSPPVQEDFQEVDGEAPDRRKARWERHQRTMERAAKALAEKNRRELDVQREQAEKHRAGEVLDAEIRKWAAGKEGNLRALLSSLQYVLWPECGWQQVSLTDLIAAASVKKIYRKATLCVHPDKVQQKGATVQQKYIAEKVFDLLKEAWNKFSSEELS